MRNRPLHSVDERGWCRHESRTTGDIWQPGAAVPKCSAWSPPRSSGDTTMQTYRFTRAQLELAINDGIKLFLEYCDKHDYDDDNARFAAIDEIVQGLDADRELVANDPTERLRLQLPAVIAADASAES